MVRMSQFDLVNGKWKLTAIYQVQIAKQEEQKLAMVENQAKKKQKIQTIQANTRLIEITTKAKAERKKIEAEEFKLWMSAL